MTFIILKNHIVFIQDFTNFDVIIKWKILSIAKNSK